MLTVDFARSSASHEIFPRPPILSSHDAGWTGVTFEYHRQPPHETREYRAEQLLVVVPRTGIEHVLAGKAYRMSRVGDVSILPPPVVRRSVCRTDAEFMLVGLALPETTAWSEDGTAFDVPPQPIVPDPIVHRIVTSLKSDLEQGCPAGSIGGESLGAALLTYIRHRYAKPEPSKSVFRGGLPRFKLKRVFDYVAANLDGDLTLAALAGQVNLSQYHFLRMFRHETGMTPHQYVLRARLDHAKHLLRSSRLPIVHVALAAGFTSQSHFTTVFRKHVGVTPFAYRSVFFGGDAEPPVPGRAA